MESKFSAKNIIALWSKKHAKKRNEPGNAVVLYPTEVTLDRRRFSIDPNYDMAWKTTEEENLRQKTWGLGNRWRRITQNQRTKEKHKV